MARFKLARLLFVLWILMICGSAWVLMFTRSQSVSARPMALTMLGCVGASAALVDRRALNLMMVLAALVLAPLALKFLLRIAFVIRYGGMDCSHCQGSPLLFLWFWILESVILFPGLVLVTWTFLAARNKDGE
jgi:hypothetical protein